MLSVRHQTKQGPHLLYTYDRIGKIGINSYMAKWQQTKRRKQRLNKGQSEYIHAKEVPDSITKQVVEMRNAGTTWSKIAHNYGFSEYLTRKIFDTYSNL